MRFINGLMKNQIKQFEEVSHTDILSSDLDPAAVERERAHLSKAFIVHFW